MSNQKKDPIEDMVEHIVGDFKDAINYRKEQSKKPKDNLEIIKSKKNSLYSYDLIRLVNSKIKAVGVPIVLIPIAMLLNDLKVTNKIIKQFDLINKQKEILTTIDNEILKFILSLDIDKVIFLLLMISIVGIYVLIYKSIKQDVIDYYKAKFKDVKFSSDIKSAPKLKELRSHRNIKNYDEITKKEFINKNAVRITLTTVITTLIIFLNITLIRDQDFITDNFYLNIISYLLFVSPVVAMQYIYSKWDETKTLETVHYHFFTNQTETEWIKLKDKVALALNSKVQKIKEYHDNNSIIIVSTMKKIPNYCKLAKDKDIELDYRLECAFKLSNIEVDIPQNAINENKYRTTIEFNCKKIIDDLLKEKKTILHNTKLANISIQSNQKTDYKIVINKDMGVIDFVDVIQDFEFTLTENLICGLTRSGQIKTLNVYTNYHSIVAGTTGGGKSNQAHITCSSILLSDIDVACFFIDPKKIELKRYRDINRVYYSSEEKEMLLVLTALEKEMDRRSELLDTDKFVNGIDWWNEENPKNKLPYIIVYIEEIGDLMDRKKTDDKNNFNKEFARLIRRIAQYGRAFGFRMFLSTQKPNADVLDTKIKDSSKTRFAFATSNANASNVILDNSKAKDLSNAGEMILQHLGQDEFMKAPLLKDKDIRNLIENIEKNHNKKGKYPLGEKIVVDIKNTVKSQLTEWSEGGREVVGVVADDHLISNPTNNTKKAVVGLKGKYAIASSADLLGLYHQISSSSTDKKKQEEVEKVEIPSINDTLEFVTIGRTKLKEFKKELINLGYIETIGNNSYLILKKLDDSSKENIN